jgi:Alr-MurF fusion protein
MYSLSQIATIVSGSFSGTETNAIKYLSVDSRKVSFPKETLFFAIVTEQRDGHAFIKELYEQGVRCFVVNRHIANVDFTEAGFITVADTLKALQQLAAYHRSQFNIPVIGITGSNGKTIVKEWLNQLLAADYNIVRSPKSYNSQIGVPLSVWQMNETNTLAIFEAGISKLGEMEVLQKIIQPTIGLLTNIGVAHDEGFENQQEKIHEKLQLFNYGNIPVIYCADQEIVADASVDFPFIKYEWGHQENIWMRITNIQFLGNGTDVATFFDNHSFTFHIPFTDAASIENCIHCIAVCRYLKLTDAVINERIQQLHPIEMRLEWKKAINNSYLLNDSYSNDVSSLIIALDYLQQQQQGAKQTVILSDILQSGIADSMLYFQVAELLAQRKVNRLVGIGKAITKYKQAFISQNIITEVFNTTDDFIKHFDSLQFRDESILLKGARAFGFEKIAALLEQQDHQTVLEINLTALTNNLKKYRSLLQPSTKMMVMVKAFGYGNGGFEIAKLLEHHKVDYLGVAFADEGIALKSAGIKLPIMVLNPETTSFLAIIQHQLEPEIYSLKGLKAFIKIAEQRNLVGFPIHIKLDTGMHRLGFEEESLEELIAILKLNTSVCVQSILSHMATTDDLNHKDFALSQISLFEKWSSKLISELQIQPIRHILNSSGISNFPEAQYDMVRLGIGIYGVSNDSDEQKNLENVGTLKSIISQIRTIQAGESVGYGRRFMASKPTKIATIPIGYADGISRHWSKTGFVTIHNQKASIVGSICMDMLMVDITEIDCKEGDSVVVFGENPSVIFMAEQLGTIAYEILTSISQRVKRVFYRE